MAVLLVGGCSGPTLQVVPVEGVLRDQEGQPVARAVVQFIPPSGVAGALAANGTTDQAGRFVMQTIRPSDSRVVTGVQPGSYRVVILTYPRGAKIQMKYRSPHRNPAARRDPAERENRPGVEGRTHPERVKPGSRTQLLRKVHEVACNQVPVGGWPASTNRCNH